jgi:hypothetical protein
LTAHQWLEDLHFFAEQLTQQHKRPFHHTNPEQWAQAVAALEADIPALESYQVVVRLQALAALIGDGHTYLATDALQRRYPLEVFWFEHELRVVRSTSAYAHALGARLVQINGHNVDTAATKLLIPQAENHWYELHQSARLLMCADALATLGVVPDPERAPCTFADDAGQTFTLDIAAAAPLPTEDWQDVAPAPPLYRQRPGEPFWFRYLADTSTMYVSFRSYQSLAEHAHMLFDAVDRNSPARLVVDMRQNGGGNYTLPRTHIIEEIQKRPQLNTYGRLFVITGRATFSAAMTNTTDFRRETDAIIVGEPPGARPQGYQENYWLTLPNSGIRASVACRHYRFTDDDVPAVPLDRHIPPRWADYVVGRDPVLEWVLAFDPAGS